jgi:hypothetical protein
LGEALLDAVIARRSPQDYRPKRPDQPANTFVSRSGEIASAIPSEATPLPHLWSGIPKNNDRQEGEVPNERPRCCG